MRIGDELAEFLTSPVMIILGTCDADGRPDIGRGVGARLDRSRGVVDVLVSGWQWPGTIANIRTQGRAAITFARPTDYVTYQLKGRAGVGEPDGGMLALSACYITAITASLCELGLSRQLIDGWLTHRDAVLLRMHADAVYVQTPGAKAGQPVTSGA